ncbi:RuBisCO large subunit C-terminal-like domain-containing protein [Haloplanus aerogenes]|uniref:Ribulose 1,5-bisphosphate carboxylase large subunit n=1 Tax=Haloplanus aerogenes TaxID=660522 RepID=A0A3M0DTE7_9EURY|nr:RuBisCO large subunit C-terminal-like domain-containing protein [Haloplanus aerogenes]AZH25705.1 hypothetical protein DU502_10080 [Haloplanus aerogenes]RMB25438.1 ribulose 1,5-bisphosphate carboxylase large subunit [Haloplanus aerogenes]
MTVDISVAYEVIPAKGHDLAEIGNKIAQEQSVGGYEWSFDRHFDVAPYRAQVRDLYDHPASERGSIMISFPADNIVPELPHLLNYVAGDVFGSQYVSQIRIRDIEFPQSFLAKFPGPQFGIDGIRERAGVRTDRPLLGMIIKPSLGLEPKRIGKLVRCAIKPDDGLRGVDVIKEDEKLVDPAYCRFEARLDEVVDALRWMQTETDRTALYVVNVTGREEAFAEYVERNDIDDVLDRFVCLQTVISNGFGQMQQLADSDQFDTPLYAHRAGHAAYTRTSHGISMRVIEKLSRLAGADFGHCGAVVGSHERPRESVIRNKDALVNDRSGWADVPRTFPVISGGVNPMNIYDNMHRITYDEFETDLLFMIGSGIYAQSGGSLDGIARGIAANRQAIQAAIDGHSVEDVLGTYGSKYARMREWIEQEDASDR